MARKKSSSPSGGADSTLVSLLTAIERRLITLEHRAKEDRRLDEEREERLMRHVDVRFEDLRGDLFGVLGDKAGSLEYRVTRLEQALGRAS
jgi:hypothetical protein